MPNSEWSEKDKWQRFFFYKNDGLIKSLYAQFFAGLPNRVSNAEKHEENNAINAGDG